jgi:hypothetical protein
MLKRSAPGLTALFITAPDLCAGFRCWRVGSRDGLDALADIPIDLIKTSLTRAMTRWRADFGLPVRALGASDAWSQPKEPRH